MEDLEGSSCGVIEESSFCLYGLRKITSNFSQDQQCYDQDYNLEPNNYKSELNTVAWVRK